MKSPKEIAKEIAALQRELVEKQIPVIVIVDGFESSGRGYFISEMIRELDPRTFEVEVFERPTTLEARKPFLWRFFKQIPKKGHMSFFDKSYYSPFFRNLQGLKNKERLQDILGFEKMLLDDNTLILKFFLKVSEKTQKKAILSLTQNESTSFLVSDFDYFQNLHYSEYEKHFEEVIAATSELAPWFVINTDDKKDARLQILITLRDALKKHLTKSSPKGTEMLLKPSGNRNCLSSAKFPTLPKKDYDKKKDLLQEEARILAYELYRRRIPTVIVFEGWDAAGKGGAIKRLTRGLDPRGYDVTTIAAPTNREAQYHYLWRFNEVLPKSGHMEIFDRSWYGRVLVERIESFATETEWKRAYDEINGFEKSLYHDGAILLKFFMHIDKEEQLIRFQAREKEAEKNYKITEEDWRNREQWDHYEAAYEEMFLRTSTNFAPWHIIPGNDKYYARIQVLKTFIKEAKKRLHHKK